jgi:hypothetical protein
VNSNNQDNLLCIELVNYTRKHGIDNYIKQAFRQIYYQAVLIFGDTNKKLIAEMTPGIANLTMGFIKRASEQEDELVRLRNIIETSEIKIDEMERRLIKNQPITKQINTVFLAYGYDKESIDLVSPFKAMLSNSGINIINGEVDKLGSLSQQIIARIQQSIIFVGILTARDTLLAEHKTIPSTWVIEEKGVAQAFGIPILMIIESSISNKFFGNIEGDAMRIEVKDNTTGAWLDAFVKAERYLKNTLDIKNKEIQNQ